MSLINQALKKAQRERNNPSPQEQPSPVPQRARQPGELRPTHAETKPAYKGLQFMVGAGILITGIVAAVALTLVLLQPKPVAPVEPAPESVGVEISLQKPETVDTATSAAQPTGTIPPSNATSTDETIASTAAQPAGVPTEEPSAVTPEPPAPESDSTPVAQSHSIPPAQEAEPQKEVLGTQAFLSEMAPEPEVTEPTSAAPSQEGRSAEGPATTGEPPEPAIPEQPVAVAGEHAEPEPVAPPEAPVPGAEPNPKVLAFLESSRITGIKVAGVHSRLLMNNQVFRTNDLVHADTQLRIKEIAPNEILFVDESGIQYRKQFQR